MMAGQQKRRGKKGGGGIQHNADGFYRLTFFVNPRRVCQNFGVNLAKEIMEGAVC